MKSTGRMVFIHVITDDHGIQLKVHVIFRAYPVAHWAIDFGFDEGSD